MNQQPTWLDLRDGLDWRGDGLRYFKLGYYFRQLYGGRVQKVSLDAGFTCPNVDGTVAKGGCVFCDNRSFSPSRRLPRANLHGQIDQGIALLQMRYKRCDRVIAYFQPATNTYGPLDKLRGLWEDAIAHPAVVGLAIGTRPDCVPDDVLDLLAEFAARTHLTVEYGLQTIHDRSLDWMNRGHHYDAFLDAMARSRGRGFEISVHVMLGLPDETQADMLATADELARLAVDSVKIHNLYVVQNTPLADQVAAGAVRLMERDEYIETVVEFLRRLHPRTVIERISGDAPDSFFLGPAWCLDKAELLQAIHSELERRDAFQGDACGQDG